jgi:hypothetical protein
MPDIFETIYHVKLGTHAARVTLAVHWHPPPRDRADWPEVLDLPRCLVTLGLPAETVGGPVVQDLVLRDSRVFQEYLCRYWGVEHPTECLRTCSVSLPAEPSVAVALTAGRIYATEQLNPLIIHLERRAARLAMRELTMERAKAL